MKKNMKIAITPEQPINEVVKELERLGFYAEDDPIYGTENFIHAHEYGAFDLWHSDFPNGDVVTLTELKNMK